MNHNYHASLLKKDEFENQRKKLSLEIMLLKQLSKKCGNIHKEEILSYEQSFLKIHDIIKKSALHFSNAKQIYKLLKKQVRNLKYNLESNLKFDKTDTEAFFEKNKIEGNKVISLFKSYNINGVHQLSPNIASDKLDVSVLSDYNFMPLNYTNKQLCELVLLGMENLNILQTQNIELDRLNQLINQICYNYHIVPYHNFTHAFSLFQMMFALHKRDAFKEYFDDFFMFTGLLSCLGHDLDHKGLNNLYYIKKKSTLSVQYSEKSVLENHHASIFFKLISNQKINLLKNYDNDKLSLTSILATDMSKHAKLIQKFEKKVKETLELKQISIRDNSASESVSPFDATNFESKRYLLNVLVHSVDLGNPCTQFPNYMKWAVLLNQEFNDQTIKEASKGLEVTEFLRFKNIPSYLTSQIFFSKTIVLPLWELVGSLIPQAMELVDQLNLNIKLLEEEKQQHNTETM